MSPPSIGGRRLPWRSRRPVSHPSARREPGEVPEAAAGEGASSSRAAAKWAKRAERGNAEAPEPSEPRRDQADVLADLAALHARFDAGELEFEDFELSKQQLTEQLDVR